MKYKSHEFTTLVSKDTSQQRWKKKWKLSPHPHTPPHQAPLEEGGAPPGSFARFLFSSSEAAELGESETKVHIFENE